MPALHTGSCLCRAVTFEVDGPLPEGDACHCSRCRRVSGHYWVSVDVPRAAVRIEGETSVAWFATSEQVRRGFCTTCGSALFWDARPRDTLAIALGAFDPPTDTHLGRHIFVADKGDYYDLTDGLPQNPQ